MAVDYKGLRNLLDSNKNQTQFVQQLAKQFLEPLFKTRTDSYLVDIPGQDGVDPTKAQVTLSKKKEDELKAEIGTNVNTVTQTVNYDPYTYVAVDRNKWLMSSKSSDYKRFNFGGESFQANAYTKRTQKGYSLTYTYDEVADPNKASNLQDEKDKFFTESIQAKEGVDPIPNSTELRNIKSNYIEAKQASELDLKNIEKYVSPTAAKGLRSLLDAFYKGQIPADTMARLQKENFDPSSEAFKLIVQNPQDFAGVASYGGITTGFKASDLQAANRIDTKKILSQTTNASQFRKVVAQEISKTILSSKGAKRNQESFQLDARFDDNSEKAILAGLKQDLSQIAQKAGKSGAGLIKYVGGMYSSFDSASGFKGSVASLAAGRGETLKMYQNRLMREQEKLTPKAYLEADSPYLKAQNQAQNTRPLVNNFLNAFNSPLKIGI